MGHLPFKISVLIFVHDGQGRQLLIRRRKKPNIGMWSPIGGKLEMSEGESPFQCAIREAKEEIGARLTESDLHLFGMISERGYEGTGHWLMFLFNCRKPITDLPPEIDEGEFAFHHEGDIPNLPIPETDKRALWEHYFQHRESFVALRADCRPGRDLEVIVEERIG